MITIGSASRLQHLHRLHHLTVPLRRGSFDMSRTPKTLMRAYYSAPSGIRPRYVQKHLGHASAEMTRRYQRRRDRFRVNLTKAAGL